MPGSEPHFFNGLKHFGPLFSSHTPSVLVIALGTNDLKVRIRNQSVAAQGGDSLFGRDRRAACVSARAIAESCARVGEKARSLFSGFCHNDGPLKILVVTPPELVLTAQSDRMGYDERSERISREFGTAFAAMCREHNFISVACPTSLDMHKSSDGVHFTKTAQAQLAEAVWDVLRKELVSRPTRLHRA